MSIATKAMVLNLSIAMWEGRRLDKEASRKVTEDANADGDAARVNKHLVPKEVLKAVNTAANSVRNHFYAHTLPWKDNGDRLLTRALYMDFIEEHERLVGNFKTAVEEFLTDGYPKALAQAEFRMGDLFNPDDYPTTDTLRRKFNINMDIDVVTESGDFRVEMDEQQTENIRRSMEQALQERMGKAMQDVWTRLADTVGHFAKKMGDNSIFRDSTVKNLIEIVDLLPGLNVMDDKNLEAIRLDVKAKLTGYDPKDLRKDKDVRSAAAKEAEEIMERMSGFMRAFDGGQ